MFDLTGKSALVTGASGGLGAEIARSLNGAGASVGLSGTREDPLNALAAELGERAFVLPCNLSDPEAVDGLPKQAIEAMGSVDILVNNAGITRDQIFMRMSDEEWQSVLDVNLTASMKLMRGVIRGMMKARWGRIVNISSVVGATGNPVRPTTQLPRPAWWHVESRGLRGREPCITVNCVAPGFITTAMTDKLTEDQKGQILGQVPAGRMGEPVEIAAAVLYLASAEAAYVTGTTLHVNGGHGHALRQALRGPNTFAFRLVCAIGGADSGRGCSKLTLNGREKRLEFRGFAPEHQTGIAPVEL